jgi:hypothetical protein
MCTVLALHVGCAGAAPHHAAESAPVTARDALATQIRIPRADPRGEVRVRALDVAQLSVGARQGVPALRVRITVANHGDDTPWVIDTREQQIAIAGGDATAPLLVSGDRDSLPVVRIDRREQRVLDLYFPLPTTVHEARELGHLGLRWQVRAAGRAVTEQTALGLPDIDAADAQPTGAGPYWWSDPSAAATASVDERHAAAQISQHTRAPSPRGL